MSSTFTVTAWNNGSPKKTGAGYGLKIKKEDRDSYFKKKYKNVFMSLEGYSHQISINVDKPSFWGNACRELISKDIGLWFIKNKKNSWSKGKPPKFQATHLGENKFRLKKI